MRLLALAAAVAALTAGPEASAQSDAEAQRAFNCTDGAGADRCGAEAERRMLAHYGLEPIERHRAASDFVRRVFYVGFDGEDLLAIAYVRRNGGEPELSVHVPRGLAAEPVAPMRVTVPEQEWEVIGLASANLDRSFTARDESPLGVCHGSTLIAEATDWPAEPGGEPGGRTRRKVENSCADGPARQFADIAALVAVPLLVPCALIDVAGPPSLVDLLRACALMSGDRYAAARAFNEAYRINTYNAFADTFAGQSTILTWPGEAPRTAAAAGALWTERTAGDNPVQMTIGRVRGESPFWATVTGRLRREHAGIAPPDEAEFEQEWGEGPLHWRLVRMTVGPFRPVR